MADFNRKKLQVFVSSTFTDLIPERQAAVEAILAAGHIPAGMELFTSGDESQMEVIKQWIDESDVYLLILGGRYGSIEPKTEKSYVHLEYEYALSSGKPLFACVITEAAIEAKAKSDGTKPLEMNNQQKLKDFRAEVLTRMCKFWTDTKDIKITVIETLSFLAKRENLVGWVRPDTQSNVPALANEITRLSKENSELRNQVNSAGEERFEGLTFGELKALMEQSKGFLEFFVREAKMSMKGNAVLVNRSVEFYVKLRQYGLLGESPYVELTQTGRRFLNKLEFLKFSGAKPLGAGD